MDTNNHIRIGQRTGAPYSCYFPPKPKWEWCFGGEWYSMRVQVVTGPNRFYRWMQRICLGIHWRRIEKENQ